MAVEDKPFVGDIGTILEGESEINLTSNSILRFEMTKPDGTPDTWNATIKSGDDSVAQYTIVDGDFDQVGQYMGNLYAEWASGDRWHGKTICFTVFALLE